MFGMVGPTEPMSTVPVDRPGAGGYRERRIVVICEDGPDNVARVPRCPAHCVAG